MISSISQRRLILLLLLLTGFAAPARAVNFNAYWLYQQSGGQDIDTQQTFQQRYNLGVGPNFSYQPTHAISASASMGYTRSQRDLGEGMTNVDTLSPSAQVSLQNDIFIARLSGVASKMTSDNASGRSIDNSSSSWDTTLASAWQIPLWPSISFNYNEQGGLVGDVLTIADPDEQRKNTSIAVDWDLLLAQLNYQYNKTEIEDPVAQTLSQSVAHFARIESSQTFLKNRLSVNLAQQYQTTTQDGFFPLEGFIAAKVDETTDLNPEDQDYLDPQGNLALRDEDVGTAVLTVNEGQRVHLGISFDTEQQLDFIQVYLDPLSPLPVVNAGFLRWALYTRDEFNPAVWELVSDNIQSAYNASEHRLDIPINRKDRDFLLVAENSTGFPLVITEVKPDQFSLGSTNNSSTSYLTNVGLRARFTKTLSASVNLALEHFEAESQSDLDPDAEPIRNEEDRRTLSGNLRWAPSLYFSPSIGFSETTEERTGDLQRLNRAYSLTVSSKPLKTLHVTLGATRTEQFYGGEKTSAGMRYSLTTSAQIYPDLNANWSLNYRTGEQLIIDPDQPDKPGEFTDSNTLSSRLNLNARLTRTLTADLTTTYSERQSATRTSENAESTLNLQYRPSDLLALRGGYTTYLLGTERPDEIMLGFNLALLRTSKTRLTLNVTRRQSDQTSNNFALDGSWDISRNLALQTRGFYTLSETAFYSLQAALTLRL